jgi:hypothetical protein
MMKQPEEKFFAVVENGIVVNIIVGVEDEVVDTNQEKYIEYTLDEPLAIGDLIPLDRMKKINAIKTKKEAEAKKIADAIEADRVKAIEAENERLRQAEADRLAAEEASKPKPVTGIFVRVEPN